MRISDWSSDVCSSDLPARRGDDQLRQDGLLRPRQSRRRGGLRLAGRLHGLGAGRQGGAAMKAVTLAPGSAAGDVFVLAEPLSCWGGLGIGRAPVRTPASNAHIVCRTVLENTTRRSM